MDEEMEVPKSNNVGGMVEVAPFYQSRVQVFVDMYESCSMDDAEEFFDDVKLRDFFGCQRQEFTTDGLPSYREALLNSGYREDPCPWLFGCMVFPVKMRWAEVFEEGNS